MRAILLFLVSAVATALQPPKSFVSNPHLRGGNRDVETNLHHGRTLLLTFPITYTVDDDFDTGKLVNVNHDVADQLQLDSKSTPFNFIWVACSGRGTIVKVDTITGTVLGEYRSSPTSQGNGNPSRTTVDKDGSVWLSNRADIYDTFGSVVHIGLVENNQCQDRNGNGKIDTSTGLNDIKTWTTKDVATAQDECIVHYTKVNSRGTRHVSIDKDNNVWVGGLSERKFDLIKGGKYDIAGSGTIIRSEQSVGFGGYGGLIDKNGFIWSASPLLRWDTSKPLTGLNGDPAGNSIGPLAADKNWAGQGSPASYGLCIDSDGNVFNTEYGSYTRKYAPDGTFLGEFLHGFGGAQGCVVDGNKDVWVAHSLGGSTVGHLKNDGTLLGSVAVGSGPTGVAVDRAGKVWATNYNSNSLSRIDPIVGTAGTVDLTVPLGAGCTPYNYGDMTGSTNIAPPNTGSWTVMLDSGAASTDWGRIKWTADVPDGSKLTVEVSSDGNTWTDVVTNGQELSQTGQKLYVRVLFTRPTGVNSPVLYDLSLITNEPPVATDDAYDTQKGVPLTIASPGVLKNDSDPDEDTLTVDVTASDKTSTGGGTVTWNTDGGFTYTPATGFTGADTFKYVVSDGKGGTDTGTVTIAVNGPPDCSKAVASPSEIWPPNHKFVNVTVNGVTDPNPGDKVTITVKSIFQDEPVNTVGDGNTCADGKITDGKAQVRAERTGTKQVPGDGRVYHIAFTAKDDKGGTCDGEVKVCVPHDQGNKKTCVDGGALNDSTKCP